MKKGIVIGIIFLFLAATLLAAAENGSVEPLSESSGEGDVAPASQPGLIAAATTWIGHKLSWMATRDYISFGRNLFKKAMALSLAVKIIAIVLFLILLIIIWNYTLRDSRANNLRGARRHHLKGEWAHARGNEERARYHYEKAKQFREKAQEQW